MIERCLPSVRYKFLEDYPFKEQKKCKFPNRASFPPASESTPRVMHGRHPACGGVPGDLWEQEIQMATLSQMAYPGAIFIYRIMLTKASKFVFA